MSRGQQSRRRARNEDRGGAIAAETGDPMTGGEDEYYRPWLDRLDRGADDADNADKRGAADRMGARRAAHGKAARPKPRPAARQAATAGETADQHSRHIAANLFARLKRGWAGFAATTIRWGESADIPTRLAALELGDKAQRLGGALSRAAGKAGRSVADASVAAGKASGRAIGKTRSKAGSAIGSAATRTRAATRKGLDSSIEATRTQGGKLADAARPMIARVAPPKPAAPVVGSALDRLVADESENARDVSQEHNLAGDLPLFGDFGETGNPSRVPDSAQRPDTPTTAGMLPSVAKPGGGKTDPPAPAAKVLPGASDSPARSPEIGDDTGDDTGKEMRNERTKGIGRGLAIIVVLAVAIIAGSTFWGRDAGSGGVGATAPGATATPDRSTALAGIDDRRRGEIEAVVEAYILDHPEIIPRALERLQQRESATAIAKLRPAIEQPFASAWGGNPKGDVVITEYSDFACTFCRRSLADVERLIKADPGVKIVYRELPILTAQSGPAAKVGLAAARKGRYRDYHLALFALGQPSEANIHAAAAKAGMTPEDVAAAKADPALDREIASNVSVAQQLRFEGTPSFVVGDQILHGAVGYDALKAAVAQARKDG